MRHNVKADAIHQHAEEVVANRMSLVPTLRVIVVITAIALILSSGCASSGLQYVDVRVIKLEGAVDTTYNGIAPHWPWPDVFAGTRSPTFNVPCDDTVSITWHNADGQFVTEGFRGYLRRGGWQLKHTYTHLKAGLYYIKIECCHLSYTIKTLY